jgi:hypothetical protein
MLYRLGARYIYRDGLNRTRLFNSPSKALKETYRGFEWSMAVDAAKRYSEPLDLIIPKEFL